MADFVAGVKTTYDGAQADGIIDLKDGLKFLNTAQDGIGLLKKLGTNKFTYANEKIEWAEVKLATRKEIITVADALTTTVTVANAKQYAKNTLIRCENEVMRVTAVANATTLTVTRGYMGTTAAPHTSKVMFSLGVADPEGSDAPAGITDDGDRFFNFSQTFTRGVSLSKDEIAALSTEGNPLNGQIKRRFIEINRELFQAVIYGVRGEDTGNKIRSMGGWTQFVTTNVTNAAGAAPSIAMIDAIILAQVQAGADPKMICCSPYQKQKIDALDVNKQLLGKREHTGGGLATHTWQSGILDHDLEIYVDQTILDDQIWIGDYDHVEIGNKSHNGVVGNFHVEDSTRKGADREERVIRGKYSQRVNLEKGLGYIYGLA